MAHNHRIDKRKLPVPMSLYVYALKAVETSRHYPKVKSLS
jgi:hypothetical protein